MGFWCMQGEDLAIEPLHQVHKSTCYSGFFGRSWWFWQNLLWQILLSVKHLFFRKCTESREKKNKDRAEDNLPSAGLFSKSLKQPGWTKPKNETRNSIWVSLLGGRDQALELSSTTFRHPYMRQRSGSMHHNFCPGPSSVYNLFLYYT